MNTLEGVEAVRFGLAIFVERACDFIFLFACKLLNKNMILVNVSGLERMVGRISMSVVGQAFVHPEGVSYLSRNYCAVGCIGKVR